MLLDKIIGMGEVNFILAKKITCYLNGIIKLGTVIDVLSIYEIYYDLCDLMIGKKNVFIR